MSGLGHLAPAFLAKTAAPAVPLWVWIGAAETNDLLYFLFTASGIEQKVETTMDFQHGVRYLTTSANPWSHGLLLSVVWSLLAAAIAYIYLRSRRWTRNRRTAGLFGLVVFSHWLLDFLMHANLPLFFAGSPSVGLGLETTGAGFVFITLLDLVMLSGSIALYWKSRRQAQPSVVLAASRGDRGVASASPVASNDANARPAGPASGE